MSEGLDAFADAEVTKVLGGLPYGRTVEQLEQEAGGNLAEAAPFTFTVDLPEGGGRTYTARLGDPPVTVASRGEHRDVLPFVLIAVAALLVILAIWVFVDARRNPRRRLRRPSERGTGAYERRPYKVYDEVEESLPAGVGGPPVEITVRHPGDDGTEGTDEPWESAGRSSSGSGIRTSPARPGPPGGPEASPPRRPRPPRWCPRRPAARLGPMPPPSRGLVMPGSVAPAAHVAARAAPAPDPQPSSQGAQRATCRARAPVRTGSGATGPQTPGRGSVAPVLPRSPTRTIRCT